jgi:transcriptional regulator with XRE-family HTH domain
MLEFSARRLRDARKGSGLSRERAAVAAGLSASTVFRYEEGTAQPRVDIAARLADVLGVTLADLLDAPQAAA